MKLLNEDEIRYILSVLEQNLSYLESVNLESFKSAAEGVNSFSKECMLQFAQMTSSIDWDQFIRVAEISNSVNWEQMLKAAEMSNSVNWDQLILTMEIVNSISSEQLIEAADMKNSMNLEAILWTINTNSMNINPILQVADINNSIDWNLIINSIEKGIIYINGAFLSPKIMHSLENGGSNKSIEIAFPAKELLEGNELEKKDLNSISIEESKKGLEEIGYKSLNKMENAILKLEMLLENKCTDESEYQSLFKENPWMFGIQYIEISSHSKFDDRNIPDFTGVRIVDES